MQKSPNEMLFKKFVYTVFVFVLGYSVYYFLMGARLAGILLFVHAALITPAALLLEKHRFHNTSRFVFFLGSLYCISSSIIGIPFPIEAEFYFIPAMMIPLILFKPDQGTALISSMTLPILAWATTKWGIQLDLGPYWMPQTFPVEAIQTLNFIGAMAISAIFLVHSANEQKAVTDRLKESSDILAKILGALPVAVFAKDIQRNYTFSIWNKKAAEIFGLSEEECIGKSDSDFFPKEQFEFFRQKDIEASQLTSVLEIPEEDAQTKNGFVKLYTRKVVIRDSLDQPKLLVGISEDITAKVAAQKLIYEQQMKMITSAKMSSLGEMASGIAHEINNPLAIIFGKAWQLKKLNLEKALEPQQLVEGLNQIENTADRIAKIIRGLRSFSRNSETDPMQPFKVSTLIEDTLELCRERFKSKGIEITTKIHGDLSIEGRSTQISQVLSNLLLNSYDAISSLSEKWVKIDASSKDEFITIKVTDSGNGIASEISDKIMQPFFTTKEVGKGTGLGLSISLGIVQEHKGKLYINSESPHTQFILELPAAKES